jgi:hypothetical protein
MRLDVLQLDPLSRGDLGERVDLCDDQALELIRVELNLSSAKAFAIGEAGMRPYCNAVGAGELDGRAHDRGVTGMESTRDIC